jgi:hypothetical protein
MNAEPNRNSDRQPWVPEVAEPAGTPTESWWQTVFGCLLAATLFGVALLLG